VVAKIQEWFGAVIKYAKVVVAVAFVVAIVVVALSIQKGCSPPAVSSADHDAFVIAEATKSYEQRLKEAKDGLAFYKKLYLKNTTPVVVSGKVDTEWVDRFFPSKPRYVHDTSYVTVPITRFDFEYPFFIQRTSEGLSISTVNPFEQRQFHYTFPDVGRYYDVTIDPRADAGKAVNMVTTNDWIVFNGFGVGMGSRYQITGLTPYFNTKTRLTFFKRVELDANISFPPEVRLETHYWF